MDTVYTPSIKSCFKNAIFMPVAYDILARDGHKSNLDRTTIFWKFADQDWIGLTKFLLFKSDSFSHITNLSLIWFCRLTTFWKCQKKALCILSHEANSQRWSDNGFLLSDPILFLKNNIHIRSDSCFGWNHTIRIWKLCESVLRCTTYIFVLCLFCLVRQNNCWSYFAFS